jgi:hypothetical protein
MTVRGLVRPLLLGGALVAAAAGWAPSAHAYTVKQTSAGATVRWFVPSVTMRIDSSMGAYFKGVNVKQVVGDATGAWHGLGGVPELLVNEGEPGPAGYQTGKGDVGNGVYLVEDWELQENALAVTVATFETNSGKVVDADVLVNANHPLVLLPDGPDQRADTFDLRGVLTHEMGHVLGLGESYDARMATMWPSVAPGETHQRDIDVDDQQGVQEAYAHALPSETEAAAGCGGSSLVVQRTHPQGFVFWLMLGACGLLVLYWLRNREMGTRSKVPLLALVLLFGSGTNEEPVANERVEVLRTLALRRLPLGERRNGLKAASRSSSDRVRLAAAAVLERVGNREDLDLATELSFDDDVEVRRVARQATERLRTAPPAARLEANDNRAQKRLRDLIGGARRMVRGEAINVGVQERSGLLWSRYLVHGEDEVIEVQIPGGSSGGLTQIVSEQEPPVDGDTIVVGVHDRGPHAWAHLRDGVVYGGSLGEGPAIQWQP